MKSNLFFSILACLLCSSGLYAQGIQRAVQSTAGGTLTSSGNQLSFTIGETVIPTLTAGSTIVTQGFQQPGEQLQTGNISGTSFCAGSNVSIPYNAIDIGGGNSFTAQLSDAAGNFANPVTIGSVAGAASGTITATIPQNTPTGTAYRIRIISSFPALTATDSSGSFAGLLVALSPNLWIGGNGTWSTASNWCANSVPLTSANVLINDGHPKLDVDYTAAGTLTLGGTGSLTILPTKTLDIAPGGAVHLGGRPVTFKSDSTGYASLGQVRGALSGTTNVTIERYIPRNGFRSWRLLSVPTKGSQTINAAWQEGNARMANNRPGFGTLITGPGGANGLDAATPGASLQRWNGTVWTDVTGTNTAIAAYKAYFLYVRGERTRGIYGAISDASATTLRTNGDIYFGDTTMNVAANKYEVIPNLYPSAINFTGLPRTGGVANTFYIWDSKKLNGSSLGMYQTFSATNDFNCLIAGGSYTPGVPNTTIESGQAFFVQSSTSGTITFRESAKISGTSGSLGLRPSFPSAKSTKIYSSFYSGDDMLDGNVVVLDAAYDNGLGMEDAAKYSNPGTNFAIEKSGKLLAIEGSSFITEMDSIQFYMWRVHKQHYRLKFDLQNIKSSYPQMSIMLKDRYLRVLTPLREDTITSVPFAVNADTASYDPRRFLIVFKDLKQDTASAITIRKYTVFPNPVENSVINLGFDDKALGRFNTRVFAANGQAICQQSVVVNGGGVVPIKLPSSLAQGLYNLEITAPDNTTSVIKVVVQ